jgi:hypothetical protein
MAPWSPVRAFRGADVQTYSHFLTAPAQPDSTSERPFARPSSSPSPALAPRGANATKRFWTGRGPPRPRRAGALIRHAEPRTTQTSSRPSAPPRIALRRGAPATRIPTGQGVPQSQQSPKPLLDLEDLRINDRRGRHPPFTHRTSEPCAGPFDRLVRRTSLKDTSSRCELTTHGAPGPWVRCLAAEVENSWHVPRCTQTFSPLAHRRFCCRVLGRDWQRLPWACIGDISDAITRVGCALNMPRDLQSQVDAIVHVTRDSMPEIDHAGVSMAHRARPSRS